MKRRASGAGRVSLCEFRNQLLNVMANVFIDSSCDPLVPILPHGS